MPSSKLSPTSSLLLDQSALEEKKQVPPATFPSFPKLPVELRLAIWSFALPDPRTLPITFNEDRVEVTAANKRYNLRNSDVSRVGSFLPTGVPTPALLHVNREARQQSIGHFKLLTFKSPTKSRPLTFYANLEIDCIYVASCIKSAKFKPHPDWYDIFVTYDKDTVLRLYEVLKHKPKRLAISFNLLYDADLNIVVQSLSGIELVVVCDDGPGHSILDYTKAQSWIKSLSLSFDEYYEGVEDDGMLERIMDIQDEIDDAVEKAGIKDFERPNIRFDASY